MSDTNEAQAILSEMLGTAEKVAAALASLNPEILGNKDRPIAGVAGIDDAASTDLTFIRSAEYAARWPKSRAGAALITRGIDVQADDHDQRALIVVDSADHALAALLEAASTLAPSEPADPGLHPTATIHDSASIPSSCFVGANASIGPNVKLGEHTRVHAGAVVAAGVRTGEHCTIHARTVLMPGVRIGSHCEIHPGAVLGADGFGYIANPDKSQGFIKLPHLAGVTLADHVEIGANTCIDRGKFKPTTIGSHTKIDNLVQIGHSCAVGERVRICGAVAIGGSTTVGDDTVIGGASCIPDNVTIAPGTIMAGGSMVTGNLGGPEPFAGYPARPISASRKAMAIQPLLPKMRDKLNDVARRLRRLEDQQP
ncbi:MAG: UDP-3-O-(3-hydroxymyristoyl)glucosamine N-acyltransferase [Planctomycetota bacterium]